MRHSSFEFADEAHRVLHASLCVRAERPITQTEATSDEIDERIEREQKLVAKITSERQPFHVLNDGIKLVAMNDQNAFARGGQVNCSLLDFDIAVSAAEVGNQLVVVS